MIEIFTLELTFLHHCKNELGPRATRPASYSKYGVKRLNFNYLQSLNAAQTTTLLAQYISNEEGIHRSSSPASSPPVTLP